MTKAGVLVDIVFLPFLVFQAHSNFFKVPWHGIQIIIEIKIFRSKQANGCCWRLRSLYVEDVSNTGDILLSNRNDFHLRFDFPKRRVIFLDTLEAAGQ
jgi:hypothetical protein